MLTFDCWCLSLPPRGLLLENKSNIVSFIYPESGTASLRCVERRKDHSNIEVLQRPQDSKAASAFHFPGPWGP